MKDRRSFFKSLALIAAGLALPKLPPTVHEFHTPCFEFNPRDYAGKWTFSTGTVLILDAPTVYAIKPPEEQMIPMIFHRRES